MTTSDALAGSTLDYATGGGTVNFGTLTSVTLGGLSGDKNVALTNSSGQAIALTVGGNDQDTTYSGAISGLGSFTKAGHGTLMLAGNSSNTYSGGTTVAAGKLVLAKTAGYAIPGDLGFTSPIPTTTRLWSSKATMKCPPTPWPRSPICCPTRHGQSTATWSRWAGFRASA